MLISNRKTSKLGGLHRLCIIFVLMWWQPTFSQTPLSGPYTVNPSGGDYDSFSDAVADLNQRGINGPVTFDIAPGTYAEQITINQINGAGSGSTITFESTGVLCDVTLSYAATSINDDWVVQLNGADYITFRNICFEATDPNLARVFYILNDANNNTIDGCQLTSTPASSASIFTAIIHGTVTGTQKNDNNIFMNNSFIDGSYGVYFEGSSTSPSSGNEIKTAHLTVNTRQPFF